MFELRGISAGYGNSVVLRDVNLRVPSASVVALLGANGAGKTTLLRVASGLLSSRRGSMLVDGVDMTNSASHALANAGICHVPEGRGIFRRLTVRDNLSMQAKSGAEERAMEQAVEAFLILGQRLTQVAGTLSGGEQQMLALARTYVTDPAVVLLDEVSMGLAPTVIDEIFSFMEKLAERGIALLIVEQYVRRALAIADYVYVLQRGAVAFVGEPSELANDDIFARYLGTEQTA